MRRWSQFLIALGLLGGLLSPGYTEEIRPALPRGKSTSVAAADTQLKVNWKQGWDTAIREAKKEGAVSIYTTWGSGVRTALTSAFHDKYGINLEFSPFSRGSELMAKVQMEQRAGRYFVDFFGVGSTTALAEMKPAGLLISTEPYIILQELKEPKYWMGAKLPFLDREKTFIGLLATKQRYLGYNTDLIKKGEITGYRDLLKPQYRDKITMNDPSTGGIGAALMAHLALDLWSPMEAMAFLTQLIKQQHVVMQRDNRTHIETVAKGKYAIGLGLNADALGVFLQAGAPIGAVDIKEGSLVTPSAGGISSPAHSAHPNAAKVFLNWLLTREGQTVFSKCFGTLSMRIDTPTEGINPMFLFQPGEKLFYQTEEMALKMGEWVRISKQIIEKTSE